MYACQANFSCLYQILYIYNYILIGCTETFPVQPTEAITTLKSQGDTYIQAIAHLENGKNRNKPYTGLSRVKSAGGLFLIGQFVIPKKCGHCLVNIEMKQLRNAGGKDIFLSQDRQIPNERPPWKLLFYNNRSLKKTKALAAYNFIQ